MGKLSKEERAELEARLAEDDADDDEEPKRKPRAKATVTQGRFAGRRIS